MAKTRPVRGIKPKDSVRPNAVKIVETRLAELLSWRDALDDEAAVTDLHNMRIAAKRLRYALEIFEICFEGSKPLIKETTGMQEALGDIHDLDVLIGVFRDRLRAREPVLEGSAVEIATSAPSRAEQMNRLRQLIYEEARDARRLGLLSLLGDNVVKRRTKYEEFASAWGGDALESFAQRVRQALAGNPLPASHDQPAAEDSTPPEA